MSRLARMSDVMVDGALTVGGLAPVVGTVIFTTGALGAGPSELEVGTLTVGVGVTVGALTTAVGVFTLGAVTVGALTVGAVGVTVGALTVGAVGVTVGAFTVGAVTLTVGTATLGTLTAANETFAVGKLMQKHKAIVLIGAWRIVCPPISVARLRNRFEIV